MCWLLTHNVCWHHRRGFPQLPLSAQDTERFRSAAFWRKVARKPQVGLDLLMFAFYFESVRPVSRDQMLKGRPHRNSA